MRILCIPLKHQENRIALESQLIINGEYIFVTENGLIPGATHLTSKDKSASERLSEKDLKWQAGSYVGILLTLYMPDNL